MAKTPSKKRRAGNSAKNQKTARKPTRGKPFAKGNAFAFKPGQSGNPAGRPRDTITPHLRELVRMQYPGKDEVTYGELVARALLVRAILEGVSLAEGAHFGEAFGLYISSTKDKCGEHLQNVRALIESSEIARYYPGLASPRIGKFGNQRGWKADAIYTQGGFTLIAASLEQGVRGLRDLERRPSFILLDDIDERDDSLQVKQEKFETLSKDIVPMLAPYGLVLYAQNLIYSSSVMDDTINRKLDWFHLRHQAGPINTFQDDLDIQSRRIASGAKKAKRLSRSAAEGDSSRSD